MHVTIGTSFTATLCIKGKGIANKFKEYFDKNLPDEDSDDPYFETYEVLDDQCHLNTNELNIYRIGYWEFGIPKHRIGRDRDFVYLHIYSNVPMQVIGRDLPGILEELGVTSFRLQVPRYDKCVQRFVDYLIRESRENPDTEDDEIPF